MNARHDTSRGAALLLVLWLIVLLTGAGRRVRADRAHRRHAGPRAARAAPRRAMPPTPASNAAYHLRVADGDRALGARRARRSTVAYGGHRRCEVRVVDENGKIDLNSRRPRPAVGAACRQLGVDLERARAARRRDHGLARRRRPARRRGRRRGPRLRRRRSCPTAPRTGRFETRRRTASRCWAWTRRCIDKLRAAPDRVQRPGPARTRRSPPARCCRRWG